LGRSIIEGHYGDGDLSFVTAYLISEKPKIEGSIRLYVDTGASRTIVNSFDAEKIRINYNKLKKYPYPVSGISGPIKPYYIEDCILIFGENQIKEYLDQVLVIPPQQDENSKIIHPPSVVGLDVLRKYRISFTEEKVILERRRE